MRLIDADALKQDMFRYGEKAKYTVGAIDRIIDNAPTVEPTFGLFKEMLCEECGKRPHGEWKLHGMIYYCSECGHDCGESGDNFCGNCGADMRKEEEND